ncbi:hypothetical protein K3G63_17490 [Hymenobacter sp. HSC-4F20]|uniref:hypothetical protein n=1 Tax=Hymenobacter sp. HSC-4F20 TaxID=2864135 RepID=UPI001C72DAC3|nr:hypothetical protein [Hymenobacter sp. HSC-4F20]MBX0292245.1 hypothetical protein [Hymenobacter sp. HSC-4F20]
MAWDNILFYFIVLLLALPVAISVYAAVRTIISRFWPMQQHSTGVSIGIAAVTTPFLCVAGFQLALYFYFYYPHRDFDPNRWASTLPKRYEMVEDLQASHQLDGLTEAEVIKLLGKPDYQFENGWEYYIGMFPKAVPIDGDALSIQFSNGKVVRYRIHEM